MSIASKEPRYPDDYDIVSGKDIVLSSFIGRSQAAAVAEFGIHEQAVDPDIRRKRKRLSDARRRDLAKRDYLAIVTADPTKRRFCGCGCGHELPPPPICGRPNVYLRGHDRRAAAMRRRESDRQALLFGGALWQVAS